MRKRDLAAEQRRRTIRSGQREGYEERRRLLLVELRLIRLTHPARRVVKHMQMQMRKLRYARKMGAA